MAAFTIGEDFQAVINGPFGSLQLPIKATFNYEQNATTLQVAGMDGITRARVVYGNWTGSLTMARADNTLDELAQQIQDTCLANGIIPEGSIDTTIYEQDGSTSTYTFNNVTFTVKSVGNYSAKKTVMQGLNFLSERRD
jgi:hypothetical protein